MGLKPTPLSEIKDDLGELEELVIAAGADVVGALTQSLEKWNSATLIGTGKVKEISEMIEDSDATLVVIDHTLSGVQVRNLEKELQVRILDRNQIILDIFAQRAQTHEGKLQVELAQLLDQMPRMVGAWLGSLSRLGGGIGTRGPGEKAIELDRRAVNRRLDQIRAQLKTVQKNRQQHRSARKKNQIPSFALIGYTNCGKSTLINTLTHADVLSKDQLFATLDPTTRKLYLPGSSEAVITDTVGFIRKLPTHLVEAFKATLEESAEADVLLHVIDLSHPQMQRQIESVNQLIEEFGWQDKPLLHVFNKVDKAGKERTFKIKEFPRVFTSALTGEGLDQLKEKMLELLQSIQEEYEFFFPNDKEYLIYELDREGQVLKKEKASQGTVCLVSLPPQKLPTWKEYLTSLQDEA